MVNQEEKILLQASNALEVCSRGVSSFVGTSEAVECHRVLLVTCKHFISYHYYTGTCVNFAIAMVVIAELRMLLLVIFASHVKSWTIWFLCRPHLPFDENFCKRSTLNECLH